MFYILGDTFLWQNINPIHTKYCAFIFICFMHPKYLSIKDYTYHLPEERIARYPLNKRDDSKLLVYKNGTITENIYQHIADELPNNSVLIFNDTRVIQARLYFKKPNGTLIEIFCLEPDNRYADITQAMLQQEKVYWKCLIGGASKWKTGKLKAAHSSDAIVLEAEKIAQEKDSYLICFSWKPCTQAFSEILQHVGNIPLPPYLHRKAEVSDAERYQTIYAVKDGSVAAPTAGLHFTKEVFKNLDAKNIRSLHLTLHVGAGTFKPVKATYMEDHTMHAEYIDVSKQAIEQLITIKKLAQPIIAVGTTSLRTLESLYWIGWAIHNDSNIDMQRFVLHQWFSYETAVTKNFSIIDALENILKYLVKCSVDRLVTRTQILIAPGYVFKMIDGLITNFHQPQSTLLLLVAALVGDDWRKIYDYALNNNFRFLSYGDGCLLMRE